MNKLQVIELFGGIGSPHKALTNLGIPYNVVDMVEFDPKAVASYNAIHGTNFVAQDVTTWDKNVKVHYLHASTPCQAFSSAGKGLGADDKRGAILWEHTIRIIKITQPIIITLENVKGLLSSKHKELRDWYLDQLEQLGYKTEYKVLNAKHYGIPQNRERVFFVSRNDGLPITFPDNNTIDTRLKDILQPEAQWELLDIENTLRIGNMLYTKNSLTQYNGKTIEINLEKLLNQKHGEINRVAKLKKTNYVDLEIPSEIKLIDVFANNASSFYGEYGVNGCVSVLDAPIQKVLKLENVDKISSRHLTGSDGVSLTLDTRCYQDPKLLEIDDLDFNQAKSYNGVGGISGSLRAASDTIHEQKILELENIPFNEDSLFIGTSGTSRTLTASQPDFKSKILVSQNECLKYRKLIPLETWLLMGFTKEDFSKAAQVNSNTQLTKQAGNSIVVNVMEAILKELLP